MSFFVYDSMRTDLLSGGLNFEDNFLINGSISSNKIRRPFNLFSKLIAYQFSKISCDNKFIRQM